MRFSVVIPLFNKAPYVKKALESVICQTFRDFELIVVDDGSADDSLGVAKTVLEGSGIDYQLIHQENAGVSTARNNGVAASHGDYICFLDADDWWAPTFLERMDWLIKAYPEAGIYGTNYFIVKHGEKRIGALVDSTGYINYFSSYRHSHMPLTSISVGIPRSIFNEESGFNPTLKLGEDFVLWVRIALKHKVAFLNEPLAFYYQDSNPKWRGTGHLTDPKHHMLWNLGEIEPLESSNRDYKRLIDELRTYSLMSYYLSDKYSAAAKDELQKVDWKHQPAKYRFLYRLPIRVLRLRRVILSRGARIKQWLIKHL